MARARPESSDLICSWAGHGRTFHGKKLGCFRSGPHRKILGSTWDDEPVAVRPETLEGGGRAGERNRDVPDSLVGRVGSVSRAVAVFSVACAHVQKCSAELNWTPSNSPVMLAIGLGTRQARQIRAQTHLEPVSWCSHLTQNPQEPRILDLTCLKPDRPVFQFLLN